MGSSLLYKGMTFAIFNWLGKIPWVRDKLQMLVSGLTRISEDIFRDMEFMSSNPVAVSFNALINVLISFSVTGSRYRFSQTISHVAERTFINFWYWFSQHGPNINKEAPPCFPMSLIKCQGHTGHKNYRIERFQAVTPVWIHPRLCNDAQRLTYCRRGTLLFSNVSISRL